MHSPDGPSRPRSERTDHDTPAETASAMRSRREGWHPRVGDWISGTYHLERVLGVGGMGMVFVAHDATLRRDIALKVLRPDLAADPALRDVLVAEAQRLAGLRHPRIVTVHACGAHRGHPYIVMELVDGSDAHALVQAAWGALPLAEVARLLLAIGEGLEALHALELVHGDVKPSNVLVGTDNVVKLTDVGLAAGPAPDGRLRGTPAYLAPERLADVSCAGRAADVYALGVTAFELATGRLPFLVSGPALLAAQAYDAPPRPSVVRPELPRAFDDAVLAALAKDPSLRPCSPLELARSLAAALGIRAPSSPRPRAAPPPLRRVIVADDDLELRQMLCVALAGAIKGCVVEAVGSGDDVLASAANIIPDAVVIDLAMPGTATVEVCARLRALARTSMKIVVVTGRGSAADWRELRAAGADACLLKPFELSQLLSALQPSPRE